MGTLLWWSCQSPVAHNCGLLNHPNHFCRGMFKLMQNLMQICCSTHSVILNVMITQYTCSFNGVHCPVNGVHWLVQWSHHCSYMHTPVPSPWLPGYISVMYSSCYINKSWTFPRQSLYIYLHHLYLCLCLCLCLYLCLFLYLSISISISGVWQK